MGSLRISRLLHYRLMFAPVVLSGAIAKGLVMKDFADKRIWILAASMLACTACVSTGSSVLGTSAGVTTSPGQFGDDFVVQATIGTIKSQGSQDRLSSRAIRLPERPFEEIAVFDYQFPQSCGGHDFRVLETGETQILEFEYAANDGNTHMIRDYVSGSNPFVKPGLWTANDHTAESISTMTSKFEQRGDGMFNGVYSQGLVTSLPATQQRELGSAYQQALSDVYDCSETSTLVSSTDE